MASKREGAERLLLMPFCFDIGSAEVDGYECAGASAATVGQDL
jgi:hypothetical protein